MQTHDETAQLSPRELIVKAIDLLQRKHGVSAAAAFEMMVQGTSVSQDKVREVAAAIVRLSSDRIP